jgi:hypothetical protein
MKNLLKVSFAALALTAVSSSAFAAQQVQVANYNAVANFTNLAAAPSIQRFNPGLGTLNFVRIVFTTQVTASVETTLTAASAPPAQAQASFIGISTLNDPGIPSVGATIASLNTSAVSAVVPLNVGQSTNFGGAIVDNETNGPGGTVFNSAADLAFFTQPGPNIVFTVDATVIASVANQGSGTATFQNTITNSAQGSITVTYDFTPNNNVAPEPGTLALLALGAVGFVAARRRK